MYFPPRASLRMRLRSSKTRVGPLFFCFFFSSFSSSSFDLGPPSSFSFPSYRHSLLSSSLSSLFSTPTSARKKKTPHQAPRAGPRASSSGGTTAAGADAEEGGDTTTGTAGEVLSYPPSLRFLLSLKKRSVIFFPFFFRSHFFPFSFFLTLPAQGRRLQQLQQRMGRRRRRLRCRFLFRCRERRRRGCCELGGERFRLKRERERRDAKKRREHRALLPLALIVTQSPKKT